MPFISTKTTVSISKEQEKELVCSFGKAIRNIGKTESYLMLDFQDNCRMHFAGSDNNPCVFMDVSLLGKASKNSYDALTKDLCDDVAKVLGIDRGCIYVKYEEADTWGMNGSNF